jgi:hypothetical protein
MTFVLSVVGGVPVDSEAPVANPQPPLAKYFLYITI